MSSSIATDRCLRRSKLYAAVAADISKYPGWEVKGGTDRLGPGLDVKGDKAVVTMPPSVRKSGRSYQWAGLDGFNAPILDAPDPWLDMLQEPKLANRKQREHVQRKAALTN